VTNNDPGPARRSVPPAQYTSGKKTAVNCSATLPRAEQAPEEGIGGRRPTGKRLRRAVNAALGGHATRECYRPRAPRSPHARVTRT